MRRYEDDVAVRVDSGRVGAELPDGVPQAGEALQVRVGRWDDGDGPSAFVWQGRFYRVSEVLAHWHRVVPWWEEPGGVGLAGVTGDEQVWRVVASAGRTRVGGTYELGVTGGVEQEPAWRLLAVAD